VQHRFTPRAIESRWVLRRRGARGPLAASVGFPSWGGGAASVVATDRAGRRRLLAPGPPVPLAGLRSLEVRSAGAGYRIDRLRAPAGATLRLVRPARQAANPGSGPTVVVRVASGSGWLRTSMHARVVVRLIQRP
jgi:hypothetical protein